MMQMMTGALALALIAAPAAAELPLGMTPDQYAARVATEMQAAVNPRGVPLELLEVRAEGSVVVVTSRGTEEMFRDARRNPAQVAEQLTSIVCHGIRTPQDFDNGIQLRMLGKLGDETLQLAEITGCAGVPRPGAD